MYNERIFNKDPQHYEVDRLLEEAKSYLNEYNIQFSFSGWDHHPDDLDKIKAKKLEISVSHFRHLKNLAIARREGVAETALYLLEKVA